ncbi:MAG: TonB-dependent receptor [Saprospiraceae bacterium]|nr:TonB-dependent receptor [Saprospiraceae bacterium]
MKRIGAFLFYDVLEQRGKTGNPTLIQTDIWNGDVRYELFPEGGQLFSVSFFYKQFNNPVEERVDGNSIGNIQSTFINTKSATNFGAELEFRKTLSFISAAKIFEDLTVFGNLALIQSKVNVDGQDRALQGQSPYAVNFGIQYNNIESGLNANITFNQVGRRINLVSGPGFPTVWENPRALVDFQIGKKIFKQKGDIKFTISDILNQYYRYYQDRNDNKKYDDDKLDNPYVAFRPGTTFGLSLSYRL